jgi:hypothetical protein
MLAANFGVTGISNSWLVASAPCVNALATVDGEADATKRIGGNESAGSKQTWILGSYLRREAMRGMAQGLTVRLFRWPC